MIGSAGQQYAQFRAHERIAREAARLGAGTVRVPAGDAEVLAALVAYFRDAQ